MTMFEWAYSGVNGSIPRNVGPECTYFITVQYRILETLAVSVLNIYLFWYGFKHITFPKHVKYVNQDRTGRKALLFIMSLIIGIEIGFKFSSRTVAYILNPCHVTTAIQLYLLAAKPSKLVTALFRIQLNLMNGPLLAFVFPETESRIIFADKSMYYLQHAMMVVIPLYLMRLGGVYSVEPLRDWSWSILAFAFNMAWHFWILQPIAFPIQVNLSHMLCPAMLDPFGNEYYRLATIIHQGILCPMLAKLLFLLGDFLFTKFPLTRVKSSLDDTIDHEFPANESNAKCKCDNGSAHVD